MATECLRGIDEMAADTTAPKAQHADFNTPLRPLPQLALHRGHSPLRQLLPPLLPLPRKMQPLPRSPPLASW